jgi:viroplasmin and RNaseH domain-containing protein
MVDTEDKHTAASEASSLKATIARMDDYILNNKDWDTKYYHGVARGRSPGLYDSPEEADRETNKVSGYMKKKFRNVYKAKDYVIKNHQVLSKPPRKKDNHFGREDSSTGPVVWSSDEDSENSYDYGQEKAILKSKKQLRNQTIKWSVGVLFAFGSGVLCGMRFRRR